jgi:hypothetical protein
MKKTLAIIALVVATCAAAWATSYLGSVVNSWDGKYEGSSISYPLALAYGDGYIWLGHHTYFIQRTASTGSIVDLLGFSGRPGDGLGYEKVTKYLYFACSDKGVFWREATTGSTVGSFGLPAGATYLKALDFDNGNPTAPLWLGDSRAWRLWNLTPAGSVVRSFRTPFGSTSGVAYDNDTAGGPFLFAASSSIPPVIYALELTAGSILYSFPLEVCTNGLGGLSWDGTYLWALDEGSESPHHGMVYQLVAHEPNTGLLPASLGRIKALCR